MPSDLRAATLGFLVGALTGGLLVGAAAWLLRPPPLEDPAVQLRAATQALLDDQARMTLMREALVHASAARVAVAEFMSSHGRAPDSNAEAQLPDADDWRQVGLETVLVQPGGTLAVRFAAPLAGAVRFRPEVVGATGGVRFECSSPDIADIARIVPGCAYRPGETRR
ncbi:MAG: pilin [Xanthomonadales bacterium]|nr:pilin [Xanthomonadales bacterium]